MRLQAKAVARSISTKSLQHTHIDMCIIGGMKRLNLIDHLGAHFKVIGEHENIRVGKTRHTAWTCLCDCGKEFVSTTNRIRSANVKSCGCMNFLGHHGNAQKDPTEVTWNKFHYGYMYNAKRRGLPWGLSKETFIRMCKSACHYCGTLSLTPVNAYMTQSGKAISRNTARCASAEIHVNGIDRINSDNGYSTTNCVTCCQVCNFAKRDMGYDQFTEWLDRITSYRRLLCE